MLTRVFKRIAVPGWTLAEDSKFPLSYTMPTPFTDDADISPWADDSLYWACIMGRMAWRNCRLAPLEYATRAEAEALFPPLFGSEMEYPEARRAGQ